MQSNELLREVFDPDEHAALRYGATPARLGGAPAGLRGPLNVEGYEVLSHDPDGRTVQLDIALWRQPFGVAG